MTGGRTFLDDYCCSDGGDRALQRNQQRGVQEAPRTARAKRLMARLTASGQWKDYWRADDGSRPYFHPSDAGLPVISLLEYERIAPPAERKVVLADGGAFLAI